MSLLYEQEAVSWRLAGAARVWELRAHHDNGMNEGMLPL